MHPGFLLSHPFRKSAKRMGHGSDGYSYCGVALVAMLVRMIVRVGVLGIE
jgi:hypothetical protein